MIRINIIGHGFVDMEEGGNLSFKTENQWFRFCEISLGRSVEFAIPASENNRFLLGYGDDPSQFGDMLRKSLDAQLVYDGGAVMGTLNVTGYSADKFSCVFLSGNADWINELQSKPLSECVTSFVKGVLWDTATPVVNANSADPTRYCDIVLYDNGYPSQPSGWQLVPSVSVWTFIDDILTNLGVAHTIAVPKELWMVAGSMKGGNGYGVTFAATADNAATVTPSPLFTVEDIVVEWATGQVFGAFVGGGSFAAKGFKALADVKVTFPSTVPTGIFLIKWDRRLGRCVTLAGETVNGYTGIGEGVPRLAGSTISIAEGSIVFFAPDFAPDFAWSTMYGWQSTSAPYSITATVDRDGDLLLGEVWQLRDNMPDMTIFEFLKSVALACGMELTVTVDGITIDKASYGKDFKEATQVIAVESVSRRVDAWGNGTRVATVDFDSDDYVTSPISASYRIDNDLLPDEKDWKSAFNEGAVSDNGVLIRDVDTSASPPKFSAKKWTLAMADGGSTYLQRIEVPDMEGYYDMATNGTCVKMRIKAQEAEFFALRSGMVWLWRGMAYLWTDAQWSSGVMTITLQKVSQVI